MTLVLGAFCADGLLIMSDREETTAGGGTKSVPKVYPVHPDNGEWWMIIGTAGRGSIADLAAAEIARWALSDPNFFTANHHDVIHSALADTYNKYINTAQADQYRNITLVIGLRHENRRISLYITDDEIPWPKSDYVCAGRGQTVADYLLGQLYMPCLSEEQMAKLCSFVMREAKDSVSDVGKETDSYFMPFSAKPFHRQRTHDASIDLTLPKLENLINFEELLKPMAGR